MTNTSVHTESPSEESQTPVAQIRQRLGRPVRFVGFWLSVTLPFLYLPLLAAGLNTVSQTITFLALLGINLIALAVGHSYRPH